MPAHPNAHILARLAALVAAAATMTHIFGPKRTAHDVLSECVVRSPVMHGGVTFVCEVKR